VQTEFLSNPLGRDEGPSSAPGVPKMA